METDQKLAPEQEIRRHPVNQITPVSKYLALLLFISLPFLGGYVGWQLGLSHSKVTETASIATDVATEVEKGIPLEKFNGEVPEFIKEATISPLIFTRKIGEEQTGERYYPVMEILVKMADGNVYRLGQVGGVNEYPTHFEISPDKTKVAVNLESKLILIDIETGAMKDLYTPKFTVGGAVAFSPDSQKVAFVDGNYYVNSEQSALYVADVANGAITEVHRAKEIEYTDVNGWYNNTIVLTQVIPKGRCTPIPFSYFNLDTKEYDFTPDDSYTDRQYITNQGVFSARVVNPVMPPGLAEAALQSMCGESMVLYSSELIVKNEDTMTEYPIIVSPQNHSRILGFSPDGLEILYSVSVIPQSEEEFNNPTVVSYQTMKLDGSRRVDEVSDVKAKLYEWNIFPMTNDNAQGGYSIQGLEQVWATKW